jgi:hypothetical protein
VLSILLLSLIFRWECICVLVFVLQFASIMPLRKFRKRKAGSGTSRPASTHPT